MAASIGEAQFAANVVVPARGVRHQLGSFAATSFVYQLLYLLQSVVVARLLGPGLLGIWESLSLVALYNVSHLGVINAVQRDIPIARGRSDEVLVDRLRSQGFVMALGPSFVVGSGVLVYAMTTWQKQSSEWRIGLLGLAILVILQQLHTYFQLLLRAENRFTALSWHQLVLCGAVGVHVVLTWVGGFAGQVLGVVFVQAVGVISAVAIVRFRPRWLFDVQLLRHLLVVGMPFGLMLLSDALLVGADRALIVALFGTTALGHYRVAVVASGWLTFLPGVMSQMLYPRMGERYGATNDLRSLRQLFEIPSLSFAVIVPLLWGGLYLLMPILVETVLPAFSAGIGPARVATLGVVLMSLFGTASYLLMVSGRTLEVVAGQLVGAAVKAVLIWTASWLGFGLQGAAVAVVIGYFVYGCWLYWRGARVLALDARDGWSLALRLVSPLGVAVALAVGLDAATAQAGAAWPVSVRGTASAAGFSVAYGAVAIWWMRCAPGAAWEVIVLGLRGRRLP